MKKRFTEQQIIGFLKEALRRQSLRRNIGQPRTLLPLSRSWFKGTLLEAHWPYRRGQVRSSEFDW
ncbi:hypothetical protein [Burkholderia mallei]|uniref:hypothetical protein n=1 Tax=Burkholderia mallei TaxID=13373 RepID=UPI0015C5196C|nr:hypothetical protein [Burkholderia mallei]